MKSNTSVFNRIWFLIATVFCAALAFAYPSAASASPTQTIYDDQLENSWQNWSWATVNFSNTSPVHSGSDSIAVTDSSSSGFEAIWLHTPAVESSAGYGSVTFWINGGATGGQQLVIAGLSGTNTVNGTVGLPPPAANTWTKETISLQSLGCYDISNFAGVWIQDNTGPEATYYLDDVTLDTDPNAVPDGNISVDASQNQHPISPQIYGVAFGDQADLADMNLTVNRWGGNSTTGYNWQEDASRHASDWFFESIANGNGTPAASADSFISSTFAGGAQPSMTISLIGWAAKLGPNQSILYSFSQKKYGAQQSSDPFLPDAGNGVLTSGADVTGNDPTDAGIPVGVSFEQGWVDHMISKFGTAANGGVKYYIMDNESSIWQGTHRDVHPNGAGMDEILNDIITYGGMVKTEDPTAFVQGPEEWGWTGYFYSGEDQQYGSIHGWNGPLPDRTAHNNMDYVPYLLQSLQNYQNAHGTRILDILSLHDYPQGDASGHEETGSATDAATETLRNESTRELWDPNYTSKSWIGQPVYLIPRMKAWVNQYYPGTKIAITEYNWGDESSDFNCATTQADILGIFGREGLDIGNRWTSPGSGSPMYYAMKIYRNYDGNKSTFGDTSVLDTAPNPDNMSSFAAVRSSDGALTITVINKNLTSSTPVNLSIANFANTGVAHVWQLSSANPSIAQFSDMTVSSNTVSFTAPSESVTLLVIPGIVKPSPPSITNATISPATLPSSGGAVTVSATVTDPNAGATLSSVTANILTNGASPSQITLSNGGSGSTYTGTFAAPANTTTTAITYTANVSASDSVSQSAGPVAATGSTVEAGITLVAPSITNATISPATLPVSGGTITVSATVTDSNPGATLSSVTANVSGGVGAAVASSGSQITLSNGGSGSTYTGTFSAAANTTTSAITYTANVSATDSDSQSAGPVAATGSSIEAGQPANFSITSASMSPATLAFAGGMITITANVVEPNQSATVTGVNVSLFKNGASYGGFKLTSAGGGVYSGSFGASQNLTGSSITYTATLSATDSVGKKASLPVSGSTVEASGSALSITSASMTPPTLTFQGGLITITASVSEPNSGAGVTGVNVSMFQNGASYGGFKLTSQGGGVYSGTFPAPKNVTGASQTYTASVKATDSAGLSATSAVSGSTVVPSGSALSIVSASMSPPTLSFSGGAITITANVNEPNASASITGVNVSMFQNGASFGGFKLTAQGGGVYSGVFGASKNLSGTALIYTATLKVTDSAGLNASAAVSGSTTEPSGSPLTITSASMSPANLTVSGGLMTFTVSVNEPNAGVTVSAVNISLFQNGGSYGGFKLSSAGGGVYTGSFPAPKNTSGVPIVYTATVKATDSAGLSATGAVAGSSTVASGAPES